MANRAKIACAGLIGLWLLVGVLDASSPLVTASIIRDADERKAFTPEQLSEIGYWRRHEWNSQLCRGQTYLEQCCSDGRPELTCLHPRSER